MCETADLDLMAAAGRGDRSAFGELVERHHTAVYQYICRFLGGAHRQAAEDLAQDTFLRAWQAAPSYEPRAKVLTWLLRIATNVTLNYRRRSRLRRTLALGAAASVAAEPDRAGASGPRHPRLLSAIAELPVGQRAALVLRHFHGLSYAEIADVLETSPSAVESLLFRGRAGLRRRLGAEEKPLAEPQVSPELGAESL